MTTRLDAALQHPRNTSILQFTGEQTLRAHIVLYSCPHHFDVGPKPTDICARACEHCWGEEVNLQDE
jgi:hypothetical protein